MLSTECAFVFLFFPFFLPAETDERLLLSHLPFFLTAHFFCCGCCDLSCSFRLRCVSHALVFCSVCLFYWMAFVLFQPRSFFFDLYRPRRQCLKIPVFLFLSFIFVYTSAQHRRCSYSHSRSVAIYKRRKKVTRSCFFFFSHLSLPLLFVSREREHRFRSRALALCALNFLLLPQGSFSSRTGEQKENTEEKSIYARTSLSLQWTYQWSFSDSFKVSAKVLKATTAVVSFRSSVCV